MQLEQEILRSDIDRTTGARNRLAVRLRSLRKTFGGQEVLKDVNADIARGEVVLLRGQNGAGKTTLLNILTGNLAPDAGTVEFSTNGAALAFSFPPPIWSRITPWGRFSPETLSRHGIGRTWQDTRLFKTQSLSDNIAVASPRLIGEIPHVAVANPLRVRREEKQLQTVVARVLDKLGLGEVASSPADSVSLAKTKLVAIARALQAGAEVLCLDEPLAGLDSTDVGSVLGVLRQLAETSVFTLVIVEHDFNIPRILDLVTTVWTLDKGRLKIEKPADIKAWFHAPCVEELPRWARLVIGDVDVITVPLGSGAVLHRVRSKRRANITDAPVLEVEDLVVHRGYRSVACNGRDEALRGMSFELQRGDLGIIEAPNGWGKTALLETIAGVTTAKEGSLKLLGLPLNGQSPWNRRRSGITLLQARDSSFSSLTVRDSLHLAGVAYVQDDLRALASRSVSSLSGGEKQRLAFTCACDGQSYDLALLDEPFTGLDDKSISGICKRLSAHLGNAAALVAVPSLA
ncbi:MAG: ATP-binding cassette domain-containing protein [Armatimonadetes bacterium]|nr:ATP-binding cassette domain-containing protein [Armatimonadota bacterium]